MNPDGSYEPCSDYSLADQNRVIQQDIVGRYFISTVFLMIDHAYGGGAPVLWETMVFPDNTFSEVYCERYTSYVDALEGHVRTVMTYRKLLLAEPEMHRARDHALEPDAVLPLSDAVGPDVPTDD